MPYPNLFNYINTNSITIQDVRETCQEEQEILKSDIITSYREASEYESKSQTFEPLTQNITRAMGDYWFSIDGTIPPGGLPHLGHLVSRVVYEDFYIWVEATKIVLTDEEWLAYASSHGGCCPYYSSGDGSTTFRTPKYDNAFLKTISSINGAGVYEEEGLPQVEITNKTDIKLQNGTIATSKTARFEAAGTGYGAPLSASNASNTGSVGMDLYRHSYPTGRSDLIPRNSIYGNSDHVTPKNMSILIGVYAVGAIVPVGTTDAEKIMSGVTRVEGILDTKLNITTIHITEQTFSDTYWCRKWSNGWIEQGGVFQSVAGASQTFTFPTPFNSVNYYMFATNYQTTDASICVFAFIPSTNTSCIYCTAYNGSFFSEQFRWYACGY